jgi:hypothetical protein
MPRKPRNANRGSLQAIEDQFADLELSQQERVLETLTSLHRWCKRERSRKPEQVVHETALELFERGQRIVNGVGLKDATDPAQNAALLLDMPEDHEQ